MYECVLVFVCVREAESVCEGKARTGGLDAVVLGSSEGCLPKEDVHEMIFLEMRLEGCHGIEPWVSPGQPEVYGLL